MRLNGLSLFANVGIAEAYLKDVGIDIVLANEIDEKRARFYQEVYKDAHMVCGDITNQLIRDRIVDEAKQKQVEFIIATPPCQGLSSAGSNRTEASLYNDPRNFLILSALNIVDQVKPDYFIVENVPRFQQMIFPYDTIIFAND